MDNPKGAVPSQLPAIDAVLRADTIQPLLDKHGQTAVKRALRAIFDLWREKILRGNWSFQEVEDALAQLPLALVGQIECQNRSSLRAVINATGVILHTNLGRSLLAEAAVEQVTAIAANYSTLEIDVEEGRRGLRYDHVTDLICRLTGAQAALVVNNNAAAVLLVLSALTCGRQVVVSRGQLVEIGGSFRVPEVMAQGGSRLVEVGTTNKTHLFDYERAITPETAALLKVHTSNYQVIGFTESVEAAPLAELAHSHGLLAIEDLGSGVLIDLKDLGHPYEPTVQASVAAGMDVVTFSGDKLLGGPQAGIIVGKKEVIAKLQQHPLTRALRIDKLTLAALEATLRLYLQGEAVAEIPCLQMLTRTVAELEPRAFRLQETLAKKLGEQAQVEVVSTWAQLGGGSLPGYSIDSRAVALVVKDLSSAELERRLRTGEPALFTRVQKDRVLLDLRTVRPREEQSVVQAILRAVLREE